MTQRRTRTLTALTGLLTMMLAVPAANGASQGTGQGTGRESVYGTGHFEGELPPNSGQPVDITMHVNATSGPSGEDPKGRFFAHRSAPTELHIHGDVTCLKVEDNRATVGGKVTQSEQASWPEGSGILIQIENNGQGSNDLPDRMHGTPNPLSEPPEDCPEPTQPTRLPVEEGNFVVYDATP